MYYILKEIESDISYENKKLYVMGIKIENVIIGKYDNYSKYIEAREKLPNGIYSTIESYKEERQFRVSQKSYVEEL